MRRFSIRTKLAVFALALGLIFGAIISGAIFLYLSDVLVKNQISSIKKIAAEQIHESLGDLRQYQLFSKMLGTRTRVLEYLQDQSEMRRTELDGIFNDYAREDSNILSIYLINTDGNTLISTDKSFVGQNYGFRGYFKFAMAGKPYVETALGKTSNEFGYYFSHPVLTKEGAVTGVLVTKVAEKYFRQPILESELSIENTVMLTDDLGVVMISNRPERFLSSLGPLSQVDKSKMDADGRFLGREIKALQYAIAQDMVTNYIGPKSADFWDEIDNEQEVLYVQRIDELPFFLVVEIGLDNVEKTVFSTVLMISAVILLAALLVAVLGYWLVVRFFIRPFKKIGEATSKIAAGDFSYRIDVKTNDELEDLASAMNLMSEKLGNYYNDLDEQVKKKTVEIEEKNEKLAKQQRAVLNILEDVENEKVKALSLAAIINSAEEPIVSQDLDGLIVSWNHGAENLYGYIDTEIIGKSIKVIVPEDKYQEVDGILAKIRTGGKFEHFQTVRKKKDGSLVDVSLSVSPIRDSSGTVIGISSITMDITKERQIDQAKTEFVSLASHQLRTPLSTINWYSEMLLNGDAGRLKPEQANYVAEIYRGNQRMVELVNALLNVSRLELGTFAIEPKLCDITKIADSAVADVDHQMFEKKIKFTKKYDKQIKEMMLDDKLTMIIFQNLLSNAVKYTPEKGKIDLTIDVRSKDLLITVSDTGMGIPKLQQKKIFSKLFRADNVRKTDTEGTGLGLYLIKSVVENVGGKIWFESEEDKGTKFFVTLPLSGMKQKTGTKSLT